MDGEVGVDGGTAPDGPEGPRRRRQGLAISLCVLTVFALAGGTALAIPLLSPDVPPVGVAAPGPSPAPVPSLRLPLSPPPGQQVVIACAFEDSGATGRPAMTGTPLPDDGGLCGRLGTEMVRRGVLSNEQFTAALPTIVAVQLAVRPHTATQCPADPAHAGYPCATVNLPADPAQVRGQLAAAGYRGAVARRARAEDAAPADSVVYAVPVGGLCVVGYQPDRGIGGQAFAMKPLPGGACLEG